MAYIRKSFKELAPKTKKQKQIESLKIQYETGKEILTHLLQLNYPNELKEACLSDITDWISSKIRKIKDKLYKLTGNSEYWSIYD